MLIETGTGQRRVAIQILQLAHFGPSRVDAERDYGQRQIDDPDAEIFRTFASEDEGQGLGLDGG